MKHNHNSNTLKAAIEVIRELYGEPCDVLDSVAFKDDPDFLPFLNAPGRCACCTANEVIVWLEEALDVALELETSR